MDIEIIKTGYLEENCYLLIKDNNCLIIDPGDDYEFIKEHIKTLNVVAVLITHHHFDHIGALEQIKKEYKVNVYDNSNLNEEDINIGNFNFEVIFTKGHSNDSISFYFKEENIIFVGDFIFKNSIGRCDLETGDYKEMQKSINKFKLKFKNNKNLIIYPGHGDATNIEQELKHNIYLQ